MGAKLSLKPVLAHEIRIPKSAIHVPHAVGTPAGDVPVWFDQVGQGNLMNRAARHRVNFGGIRPQRLQGIEHSGQLFIDDLDAVERLLRTILVDCSNGGHFFADVAHSVIGQHVLISRITRCLHKPVAHIPRVPSCNDRLYPGDLLGPGCIDMLDARMRQGAPQNLGAEHTGQFYVDRVLCLSGDLCSPVNPRYSLSDDLLHFANP